MSAIKTGQWKKGALPILFGLMGLFILFFSMQSTAGARSQELSFSNNQPLDDKQDAGSITELDVIQTAQTQDGLLELAWASAESQGTSTLAWGDIDGDGDLDLFIGNAGVIPFSAIIFPTPIESNKLLRNDGNGNFVEVLDSGIEDESSDTTSAAWGDIDGDGDLDLVIGNNEGSGELLPQVNQLYRNNGNGFFNRVNESGFHHEDLYYIGTEPHIDRAATKSVVWGDLDGDGDLDLIVGNENQANVVYRNDGSGTFSKVLNSGLENERDATQSIATGDIDGDGDLDLVVGNENQANIVYRNDGSGMFSKIPDSGLESYKDTTQSIAVGDIDGDGDLDLAVGNHNQANKVYRNIGGGSFTLISDGLVSSQDATRSIALGDIDRDGDLDFVVGNENQANKMYLNNGSGFFIEMTSFDNELQNNVDFTQSIALGDADGDGDLDLATGNWKQVNTLYKNIGSHNFVNVAESGLENADIIRLGDFDRDGDLDSVISKNDAFAIYQNNGAGMFTSIADSEFKSNLKLHDILLGDIDGDADLDLLVSLAGEEKLYRNNGKGGFSPVENSGLNDKAVDNSIYGPRPNMPIAFGDIDGDGDLDLLVGIREAGVTITYKVGFYYNNGEGAFTFAGNKLFTVGDALDAALDLGDIDGDGDLDLVFGLGDGAYGIVGSNVSFLNNGSGSFVRAEKGDFQNDIDITHDITLGDVDGDGDLDLLTGNEGANRLYLNNGNGRFASVTDSGLENDLDSTERVVLNDIDLDGDLDIVTKSEGAIKLYRNNGSGKLSFSQGSELPTEIDVSGGFELGDIDKDGDFDLVLDSGHIFQNTRTNNQSNLPNSPTIVQVNQPFKIPSTSFIPAGQKITSTIIPIPYALKDNESDKVGEIKGWFSVNGGGLWHPAVATNTTITTNLSSSPWPNGTTHIFEWDMFASGFFGSSNNVVFRIEAFPATSNLAPPKIEPEIEFGPGTTTLWFPIVANNIAHSSIDKAISGPFPYGSSSATTAPFAVRGTQTQVFAGTIDPDHAAAGAFVYRIESGSTAGSLISTSAGQPFTTDSNGFLQGQGELQKGDRLFALYPVSITTTNLLPLSAEKLNIYSSSFKFESGGLETFQIQEAGVQTLVVSKDSPLELFNLDISLEWDARQDEAYMGDLKLKLREASDLLFDWTNGQMALGKIRIYHNKEKWNEVDIQIFANNQYRPNADIGGIISETMTAETALATMGDVTYHPGQLRIGATWSRQGKATATLGEDWARVLVHELGHYLLFMDDNYYGFDEDGKLISINSCSGVMANPYIDSDADGYDEFHSDVDWVEDNDQNPTCKFTVSHQETGRSDWATLKHFYPFLKAPSVDSISGPNFAPIAPDIEEPESGEASSTLINQNFAVVNENNQPYSINSQSQGFIVRDDTRIIKLGELSRDQLLARGAQPGDQLCLQNLSTDDFGCKIVKSGADENYQLTVDTENSWRPDIVIQPVTSTTVNITVTLQSPASDLQLTFIPNESEATVTQTWGSLSNTQFITTLELISSTVNATILISGTVLEDGIEQPFMTFTDYKLGGSPGCGWWGRIFGCNNGRRAPILSSDGRATVLGKDLDFPEGEFYILQTAGEIPPTPKWGTVVGQPYRLTKSDGAPDFKNSTIQLSYLEGEVPKQADTLTIYYHYGNGAEEWKKLDSASVAGIASAVNAQVEGQGVYIILATISAPQLEKGWNLFAYPNVISNRVDVALASLSSAELGCLTPCYTSVYQYQSGEKKWLLFDQTVSETFASKVNTLQTLEPLNSYWIYATKSFAPIINPESQSARASQTFELPPATFYGVVVPSIPNGFDPQIGDIIEARIGGNNCGTGEIFATNDGLGYVVQVKTNSGDGCALPGDKVTFVIDGQALPEQADWDNAQACYRPLAFTGLTHEGCNLPDA